MTNEFRLMNNKIEVGIRLISPGAQAPLFAHGGDACADIYANEDKIIPPKKIELISTGFSMEIPIGYEAQIRPRSGLAIKNGIGVLNSPGTIDSGYRGEVKIILINLGDDPFKVRIGDRIAQIGIREVPSVSFMIKDELSDTKRGEGGFGSTGI
jgi:dUTP pyrophosphatase